MQQQPTSPIPKQQLKKNLLQYLHECQTNHIHNLQNQPSSNPTNITNIMSTIELRLKLIQSLITNKNSITRLQHLQRIFKHYCTHIFKTGKHMTFQRLQYEKVHMTMDRFFLFVKDFQLVYKPKSEDETNKKKQQIINRNQVVLLFKRISKNSRQVGFQEFIQCIERLAIMYYNQKDQYSHKNQSQKSNHVLKRTNKTNNKHKSAQNSQQKPQQKAQQNQQQREEIENNDQKQSQIKEIPQNQNKQYATEEQQTPKQDTQNKEQAQQQQQQEQQQQQQQQQVDHEQNEQQQEHELQQKQQEQEVQIDTDLDPKGQKSTDQNNKNQNLLILTNQQKIEYFYKFIVKVDTTKQYRDKLTKLNLPNFQKDKNKLTQSLSKQQKFIANSQEEIQRMEELKKKLEDKKNKQKAVPIPKPKQDGIWAKAEEGDRKRRQMKKQRESKAKSTSKITSKETPNQPYFKNSVKQKALELSQQEIDWSTLGQINLDQLKNSKFNVNLKKYFSNDEDDKIFLEEYQYFNKPKIGSVLEMRQKKSLSIIEGTKKRVSDIEKKQSKQQKELEKHSRKIGQSPISKNRI